MYSPESFRLDKTPADQKPPLSVGAAAPRRDAPRDRPVLMLLFSAGGLLYAIESRHVVEVIPRVNLRPVLNQSDQLAGMFNYRGSVLPVVDLCRWIHGSASGGQLSSRIIMVNIAKGSEAAEQPCLGLLAEGVTDTLSRPLSAFQQSSLTGDARSCLGGLHVEERGMVQLLHLERLLQQLQLPGAAATTPGSSIHP